MDKTVEVYIPALDVTVVTASVKEHRIEDGVYVFDLLDADGSMIAENRYAAPEDAPFELTLEELLELNPPPVEEESEGA